MADNRSVYSSPEMNIPWVIAMRSFWSDKIKTYLAVPQVMENKVISAIKETWLKVDCIEEHLKIGEI